MAEDDPVAELRPDDDVAALVSRCRRDLGPLDELKAPRGYWHSGLALLDAIWSIGVRYPGVIKVLQRYCEKTGVVDVGISAPAATAEHTIADFLSVFDSYGVQRFIDEVVRNRQLTSTRNGILKADACGRAARALTALEVTDRRSVIARAGDEVVRDAWLSVPGQGSGISWHYFLMNCGVEHVKPDRMICRFVAKAIGRRTVKPNEADRLIRAAWTELAVTAPALTLRALDHAIWRHQSGRKPRGATSGRSKPKVPCHPVSNKNPKSRVRAKRDMR